MRHSKFLDSIIGLSLIGKLVEDDLSGKIDKSSIIRRYFKRYIPELRKLHIIYQTRSLRNTIKKSTIQNGDEILFGDITVNQFADDDTLHVVINGKFIKDIKILWDELIKVGLKPVFILGNLYMGRDPSDILFKRQHARGGAIDMKIDGNNNERYVKIFRKIISENKLMLRARFFKNFIHINYTKMPESLASRSISISCSCKELFHIQRDRFEKHTASS